MNHNKKSVLAAAVLVFFVLAGIPCVSLARTIVDMAGRPVTLPDHITKIYGTSPPATNLILAVAPDKLAAHNTPLREGEKKFMNPRVQKLPVVGGWFGQGQTPNMESLMAVRPDLILVWQNRLSLKNIDVEKALKPLNAPLVFVVMDRVEDYPKVFRFMGKLLGEEQRTESLARYAEKTLADMKTLKAAVPENKRLTVYYAENDDGLSTECTDSMHTELIPLCGGINVHACKTKDGYGMDKISLEQVLVYDPQVIVTHSLPFYNGLFSDKRWKGIRAVKDKRVYLIPRDPMNWFDRPPSFMRLIGARWLAHCFYPEKYPWNPEKETQTFYSLFLGYNLTDDGCRELVRP
jgi:iron complex transport system substrate-binding protein